MTVLYNRKAPKKPTNLSINSELLAKARNLDINLSSTLEHALELQLRQAEKAAWRQENTEAIKSLNELADKNGLFSDSFRGF